MKKSETTSDSKHTPSPKPQLVRPQEGRMLAGVGIGLARYLDVDVWLVRLLMLIVSFMSFGTFILAYVFLWLVVPASTSDSTPSSPAINASSTWVGLTLILIGGYFLAKSLGWLDWVSADLLWPTLVIAAGVALLIKSRK